MKANIIGERIKALRNARQLTQLDVAERIGFSPGVVSQWETGTRIPRPESLVALSNLYGVSLSYLMGEDDEENAFAGLDDLHRAEKGMNRLLSALGYFSEEKKKVVEVPFEDYYSGLSETTREEIKNATGGNAFVKDEIHFLTVWNDSERYEILFDDYLDFVDTIRETVARFLKENDIKEKNHPGE